jgi:hypothetical protein
METQNKTNDEIACEVKQTYNTPELVELGNVAELTNYTISTIVN